MKAVLVLVVLLLPCYSEALDSPLLSSIDAHDLDNTLPSKPLDVWLKSVVPSTWEISQTKEVTDCGEYSGNPEQKDYPLCLEVSLINGSVTNYLYVYVGTNKLGISGKPTFFWGLVDGEAINKLSELHANSRL